MVNHEDLIARALSAYFRNPENKIQPAAAACTVEERGGLQYVVLRNNYDTIAAYRVRQVAGKPMLKRIKRLEFLGESGGEVVTGEIVSPEVKALREEVAALKKEVQRLALYKDLLDYKMNDIWNHVHLMTIGSPHKDCITEDEERFYEMINDHIKETAECTEWIEQNPASDIESALWYQ